MRGFQLSESQTNRGPIKDPRPPHSNHGTTSGRATNELIEQQERPNATAGRRTGHGSDKEAQTQDKAFEAAPKWLILHLKQKGKAEPPLRMQKQPQLPYTMTAPSNYRRKWGSSTRHTERRHCSHTSETTEGWGTNNVPTPSRILHLARQPVPHTASGQRRTATASMTASGQENGEGDRWTANYYSDPLESKLKRLQWMTAAMPAWHQRDC